MYEAFIECVPLLKALEVCEYLCLFHLTTELFLCPLQSKVYCVFKVQHKRRYMRGSHCKQSSLRMHVKIDVYFYHTIFCPRLAFPQLSERMKIVDVVGMRAFKDEECIITQVLWLFTVQFI